jgi:hypothetical protein
MAHTQIRAHFQKDEAISKDLIFPSTISDIDLTHLVGIHPSSEQLL